MGIRSGLRRGKKHIEGPPLEKKTTKNGDTTKEHVREGDRFQDKKEGIFCRDRKLILGLKVVGSKGL